jgi:hypothetical protein
VPELLPRLKNRLRERLIDDVLATGTNADRGRVESVVNELLAERPILDWLIKFDWSELIELVLKLIAIL